MKLWDKGTSPNREIERFTVGKDRELDIFLAPYDIIGSIAHAIMIAEEGLITSDESRQLVKKLREIYHRVKTGEFIIEEGVEDVHSQVEKLLTESLGDIGKKIHSGRSRNDQVLLDLRLFTRDQLVDLAEQVKQLFTTFQQKSEEHKNDLLPGYTHTQLAMPSSFGLWFGAYAENLVDDLNLLFTAFEICNQNPLGSAAGFGSSFPLNRKRTTELLGFDNLNYNVVYAQMGRGKLERVVSMVIGNLAAGLAKYADDCILYMNQNFGFISFPDELTTGSSIMPHKKNPDVFEMIRGRCNRIQSIPFENTLINANMISGYHRDLQLIKENYITIFSEISDCLQMTRFMTENICVKQQILNDPMYLYLFTVEEVNRLVNTGVPFRDAYYNIGKQVENNAFTSDKMVNHTHEGSINNLCNDEISAKFDRIFDRFPDLKAIERNLIELNI